LSERWLPFVVTSSTFAGAMSFCAGAAIRVNTKDTAGLLSDDKFLALEEEVEIIPKFTSDGQVECIKGKLKPFRAHAPVKVPLWAALEMDRLQQCSIELPHWLHEEELKRLRDEEKDKRNADVFMEVPEHYVEIAFSLLTQSKAYSGDPRKKSMAVLLLREIIEIRRSKIIKGQKELDANSVIDVTNMSAAELSCFRARSLHTLDTYLDLMKARRVVEKEATEEAEDTTQQDLGEDSSSRLL